MKLMATAALLALMLSACSGMAPESRRAAAGPLSPDVVPLHYEIELKPDLDTLSVSGHEVIDIDVRQPTDRLTLNAMNMAIGEVSEAGGSIAQVSMDAGRQTATFTFPRPLAAGTHKLRIAFTSRINSFGRGLFYVDYPQGAGRKRMIATHLEPAEARRIFPAWDVPGLKATFSLSVTVPRAFLAASNMPVERETPVDDGNKRVSFARTPKMSTYLFVLVAGELERVTRDFDGVELGVVTTAGKSGQGRYALDSAIPLLAFYNDYFGMRYPLPKLDLIAVPGGIGGAMENWGGIVFAENLLLFEPGRSSPADRRGIFSILAHEMAHLWFGDLVTMAWWDDLWLNEGFASWMEVKAAERLHPEWQPWLNRAGAKQRAMRDDARRSSHPIEQAVADESEASAAFDNITYLKGQQVIRMLEDYLGEEAFRTGLRAYIREHAYGNASTQDLWRALGAASGKPVERIASSFTKQAGVPLVIADTRCESGTQRMRLRQERYTLRDPAAPVQRWQVPVSYLIAGTQPASRLLLDGSIDVAAGRCGDALTLNAGDVGYYRVEYGDAAWSGVERAVTALGPAERANLGADAWALAESGRTGPERFFRIAEGMTANSSRVERELLTRVLEQIDFLARGMPARGAFRSYAVTLQRPVLDQLGWQERQGEIEDSGFVRVQAIRALGELGDAQILAEARRRFAVFLKNPNSLRPGLRNTVFDLVGRECDRATCDTLLGLARKTVNLNERRRFYLALARARDAGIAAQTLALALRDELPTPLVGAVISTVSSEHPELGWNFVQANFAALEARLGPNYANSAPFLLTNLSDATRALQLLEGFEPAHRTPGGRIQAARVREIIAVNAELRERLLPAVDAWVRSRPLK
jgi:aminopeptidase N